MGGDGSRAQRGEAEDKVGMTDGSKAGGGWERDGAL